MTTFTRRPNLALPGGRTASTADDGGYRQGRAQGATFFIIGAPKAGTVLLSSQLARHPDIAFARPLEPHFFSYDHLYERGWDVYIHCFDHCHGERALGDASTSYSRVRYFPDTARRIKTYVPDARLIYVVRHPLERMAAAYVEHVCTATSTPFSSLNEALIREPMILDSSRYWEVFQAYRRVFTESRIVIVWFDEFMANTMSVVAGVCKFLGANDHLMPTLGGPAWGGDDELRTRLAKIGRGGLRLNTGLDDALRRRVLDEIEDDSREFLTHFGKPLDYWHGLELTKTKSRGGPVK